MLQNASLNDCGLHLIEIKLTKTVTLPKIPSALMGGNPQLTEEDVISGSTHHLQLLPKVRHYLALVPLLHLSPVPFLEL